MLSLRLDRLPRCFRALGFGTSVALGVVSLAAAPTHVIDEAPIAITEVAPGVLLVDFGQVAFGNLQLRPSVENAGEVTVHFGEALSGGRINRQPPGTVRYGVAKILLDGKSPAIAAPPPDARNTRQLTGTEKPDWNGFITPPAILTPAEWGVLVPFRWVEIEGWRGELRPAQLNRRAVYAATWDDTAAAFRSSDELYDRIWELCRHSIKATTFAGVYVDGDRERIPYEADAYLNQLSHYATDRDVQMARDTYDHLMKYPTWPTEWASHLVFMVHADWMHTGDRAWLAERYEALKGKLLLERLRGDGLVASGENHVKKLDIVDWPVAERDGFVFTPANAVINAFFIRGLEQMAELARALGKEGDASDYASKAATARLAFQRVFFDAEHGRYRDGEGTDHASQHANLFALAFGLVPDAERQRVTAYTVSRGMACSVYAAQYLLEGLFENDSAAAHALITAPGDRSWRHMVESGTTITWEAWDQKYKPNQDWNHAWGAGPANLFPRFVLGVQATQPGWTEVRIKPHPGPLTWAEGKVPTPRGAIGLRWENSAGFRIMIAVPKDIGARVELPAGDASQEVFIDGRKAAATREGDRWILEQPVSGMHEIEVR